MDSFMVDTSGVDCKEGDGLIFSTKNTILLLSKKWNYSV